MESLFSFIKSYIPTTARDPQEDYLTQLLAWILNHIPGLGVKYCQFLLNHIEQASFSVAEDDTVIIETQVVVVGGRIDLLIKAGSNGFICEHKVSSGLGDQQIARYEDSFSNHAGQHYSVLITADWLQHTQPADIQLVWADVYDFFSSEQDNYESADGFLINQFIEFLRQQGLGRMEPLTIENILGYLPGQELPDKLEMLLPKLVDRRWEDACPYLIDVNRKHYHARFNPLHWGRIGIDFHGFPPSSPSIFAGVMISGKEHCIDFVNPAEGPDIVVFLEYEYKANPERVKNSETWIHLMQKRNSYISHPNFIEVCTRLTVNSGNFHYRSIIQKSPWRLIVLQQPLSRILRGAQSEKEQLDRLFSAFCHGINIVTQDGLLGMIPSCDKQSGTQ